jgi:transposase
LCPLDSVLAIELPHNIAVIEIAARHGHKVLFTPPYHSDLQPIEMLWAYVKGNVGRKYNSNTTFEDVRTRLIDEFDALWTKSHLVNRIIAHVDKALRVYLLRG